MKNVTLQLAWRFNMYLVNIELMFAKFWTVTDYLSDKHHLNQEANLQVLKYISTCCATEAPPDRDWLGPSAPEKSSKAHMLELRSAGPTAEARNDQPRT